MIIDYNRISGNDFNEIFHCEMENAINSGEELIINLKGWNILQFEEIRALVLQGLKCRIKGVSLKMINVSEAIRGQLIMIGIHCRDDEVIIN